MHIFPFEYNELLPFYYNNNQRFIQKRLDPKIIKSTKIFEKEEIKWYEGLLVGMAAPVLLMLVFFLL